jgi:hypothetical protein
LGVSFNCNSLEESPLRVLSFIIIVLLFSITFFYVKQHFKGVDVIKAFFYKIIK